MDILKSGFLLNHAADAVGKEDVAELSVQEVVDYIDGEVAHDVSVPIELKMRWSGHYGREAEYIAKRLHSGDDADYCVPKPFAKRALGWVKFIYRR